MKRRPINPGNWSLISLANYADQSHEQIKRLRNLIALKFLSGCKNRDKNP